MKTLIYISFLLFISCTIQRPVIEEDVFYKTREYVGHFDTIVIEKKTTMVYTDQAAFTILGTKVLPISKGERCYIRTDTERMIGTLSSYYVQYFTWDGNEYYYRLRQNHIGEIY